MSHLLQLDGVTKSFGGVHALSDVRIEASAGEVHALLGENGAGKSTCIKILAGALRPDSGTIAIRGEAIEARSPQQAVDHGIAAVFQEFSLIPDLSVSQNVYFGREPMTPAGTVSARAVQRKTAELFEQLQIRDIDPGAMVRDLNVGERQLVEIAKALSTDPSVLILDEATSALGAQQTEWLLDLARRLAARDVLVIFISHRMREVRQVADRLTVLRNGSTVGTYDLADVTDDEIVTLMLGRRAGQLFPDFEDRTPGEELLAAEGLHDGRRLQGVDLSLHAGEILGVGGLQGQGQQELFQCLAGARRASGTLRLSGKDVRFRSVRDAMRRGVGVVMVPEDRKTQGLLLQKSVRENLTLATVRSLSRWGFMNRSAESRAVADSVARFDVAVSDVELPVNFLSGGNQQKVVIAKFLRLDARVVLLFDPTRGVDVGTKADVFALMHDLADRGYAVLFFSTDNEELVHVCDRVAVMSYGRIARVIERHDLSDEAILSAAITQTEAVA